MNLNKLIVNYNSILKPAFFILSCLPIFYLAYLFYIQDLGSNPIEKIIRYTGLWTFRFLILTLSISILREQFNLFQLFYLRRMFGLFTFFYSFLHFSSYIVLDQYFDWLEIWLDIKDHPFITSGFLAFLLLLPLALTSNTRAINHLGALVWGRLHKLIYLIALCSILHYFWMAKLLDVSTFIYLFVLLIFLFYRIPFIRKFRWNRLRSNV